MVNYSDAEIIEAYKTLGTQTAVSKTFGISQSYVHKVMKRNSLKADGNQRVARYNQKVSDDELIEACKTMSSGEIQRKYDIRQCSLYERCKKLGIKPIKKKQEYNHGLEKCRHKKDLWKGIWHYHEPHAKKFADRDSVRYLESKGTTARIECEICGHIYEVDTSRKYRNWDCKECQKRRDEDQLLKESRRMLIDSLKKVARYKEPRECACCGSIFYALNDRRIYCSDKCKRIQMTRNNPKSQSYRGRCRRYGSYYDPSVKRDAVIKRDKGVCRICGKRCNPNDKRWGTSGPDYPTVDHIRPLSKGGTHTWDNVQCACGMCNSEKRDLLYG